MAFKVFVTGVTGYIGGDAFFELASAHPEWDFTCIVRNSEKGAQVASKFPKVKLVYGDLDSTSVLREEASKADVVLNCASADHGTAAEALIQGLGGPDRKDRKGYLIHTSGTGVLMHKTVELAQKKGNPDDEDTFLDIYDDWDGINTVTSLPDFAPHRTVDKIVIAASHGALKTAIVCPPCIYGPGRGPGNQRSIQLPTLASMTLSEKHGVKVRSGKVYWSNVHVQDLSRVFLRLVEYAATGDEGPTWGPQGYYFAENGERMWGDVAQLVANDAAKQGLIDNNEVQSVSNEEIEKLFPFGSILWGGNSRSRAIRARKLLGWEPIERSLEDEIQHTVKIEADRQGLIQGHAAVAAG